jgi:hypothetical protein
VPAAPKPGAVAMPLKNWKNIAYFVSIFPRDRNLLIFALLRGIV